MHQADLTPEQLSELKRQAAQPLDAEEQALVEKLRPKGPATFFRGDPYDRNRHVKRGDRRRGAHGQKIGPIWKQEVVFTDDSNAEIDVAQTNYAIAAAYLRRRSMPAGRASSFKKLSKAARLLNAGAV